MFAGWDLTSATVRHGYRVAAAVQSSQAPTAMQFLAAERMHFNPAAADGTVRMAAVWHCTLLGVHLAAAIQLASGVRACFFAACLGYGCCYTIPGCVHNNSSFTRHVLGQGIMLGECALAVIEGVVACVSVAEACHTAEYMQHLLDVWELSLRTGRHGSV